jgi:exopolysaccharide biosynthesis WecB/TagA/CpsF family protein
VIDLGKREVLGVSVDAVDYDAAVERILTAAHERRPYSVAALAVHGVMTGADDPEHRTRLNRFDLLTPDGQPVRWSLNILHKTALPDRVYGPELTRRVLRRAASEDIPVFLYGSTEPTLALMQERLRAHYPGLSIAGSRPSRFGTISEAEATSIRDEIAASGARITLVGLGCPRQEIFVFEHARELSMPLLAVGAAFDYFAGTVAEPPAWIQRSGLQWAYRLRQDPRRLWRRYVVLNPRFVAGIARQWGSRRPRAGSDDNLVEPTWTGWA